MKTKEVNALIRCVSSFMDEAQQSEMQEEKTQCA